jgi:excinuclease ABC subunit B
VKPIKEKLVDIKDTKHIPKTDMPKMIIDLEYAMRKAADELDFERAIALRDKALSLRQALSS